ncbi:MAG: hypothetical protein ACO3IT_02035 [Ilumatobacteraceae bacterium]
MRDGKNLAGANYCINARSCSRCDGHISIGESIRAEAGLLEEFTKEPAKAKGLKGWINRLLGRGLNKIDND